MFEFVAWEKEAWIPLFPGCEREEMQIIYGCEEDGSNFFFESNYPDETYLRFEEALLTADFFPDPSEWVGQVLQTHPARDFYMKNPSRLQDELIRQFNQVKSEIDEVVKPWANHNPHHTSYWITRSEVWGDELDKICDELCSDSASQASDNEKQDDIYAFLQSESDDEAAYGYYSVN